MSDLETFSQQAVLLATELGQGLLDAQASITTAESCTGGLIAAAITDIAGSSAWFAQGQVTYSNDAKHKLLGVAQGVFEQHGAVSEACVLAMAQGALERSGADVAVAVSGIAGPDGGTAEKPLGTVWLAWATALDTEAQLFQFTGNRQSVREQAVLAALSGTISRLPISRKSSL